LKIKQIFVLFSRKNLSSWYYIKFTPGVKDIQILATKGVTTHGVKVVATA